MENSKVAKDEGFLERDVSAFRRKMSSHIKLILQDKL